LNGYQLTPEQIRQAQMIAAMTNQQMSPQAPQQAPQMPQQTPQMPQQAPQMPQQAPQQQGLLSRLGSGISNYLSDPENRARLAAGFNTMRLNPDPNIAAMAQSRIESSQAKKLESKQVNKTVELLRKMGRGDLAAAVESNPSLAIDALKQVYGLGPAGASAKSYAPQLDPATGQYYVTTFDPETGKASRVDVGGAVGETPETIAQREQRLALEENDFMKAQEVGQATFSQAGNIDGMINRLTQAYTALEQGGKSGVFQRYLPAFDEATASLRQAANQLGIDIINSATFGALSEKELGLALETGLPMSLDEEELKSYIRNKVAAQVKLRDELIKKARALAGGQMKYSDFINQYSPKGGTEVFFGSGSTSKPSNVPQEVWDNMTPDEKSAFK
jgi:hypothetical protein